MCKAAGHVQKLLEIQVDGGKGFWEERLPTEPLGRRKLRDAK